MNKKLISIAAAAGICLAAAGTVSADYNTANASPERSYLVNFDNDTAGTVNESQGIYGEFNNQNARTNFMSVTKVSSSGSTPEIISGKFGKTAQDQVLYAKRTDSSTSKADGLRIDRGDSANGSWFKNYSSGTKIKQSFSVAFDKNVAESYSFVLQMTGTPDGQNATSTVGICNGTAGVLMMYKNNVKFFGKDYAFNILDSKWYDVDIVYTVGSSTVKNTAELYIDGKYIARADFTLSKTGEIVPMYGIVTTRYLLIQKDSSYLTPEETQVTGVGHYIDNISWTPYAADYTYSPVSVTSSSSAATVIDGAVVLNSDMTVAELKDIITAGSAAVEVVSSADGSTLADDAAAEGAMLKITDETIGDIYYKVGSRIMLYSEDFEADAGFAEGKPYIYWDSFTKEASGSAPGIAENIGGKSGKSFKIGTEATMNSTTWSAVGRTERSKTPVYTVQGVPLVAEIMINNTQEDYVSGMLRLAYKVSGTTFESNAVAAASNGDIGVGYNAATVIGKSKQGQWNKIVLVINPDTLTADAYLNGEKKNSEPIALLSGSASGRIDAVTKLYLRTWSGDSLQLDGYTAFDDIKLYAGNYAPSRDAATIASDSESIVIGDGIISIPDSCTATSLKNLLTKDENTALSVYTDNTYTVSYSPVLPLVSGAYLVETAENGAIHYYEIITAGGKSKYNAPVICIDGIDAGQLPAVADGTTVTVSAATKVQKYNDADETILVLAAYKDGHLEDVIMNYTSAQGYNRLECNWRNVSSLEGVTVKAFLLGGMENIVPLAAFDEAK